MLPEMDQAMAIGILCRTFDEFQTYDFEDMHVDSHTDIWTLHMLFHNALHLFWGGITKSCLR